MTDSTIRTAVALWFLGDGLRRWLGHRGCERWAVHSVTDMRWMFLGASAFDQDLGWCVDNGVDLTDAFYNTLCASTSCGVTRGSCP